MCKVTSVSVSERSNDTERGSSVNNTYSNLLLNAAIALMEPDITKAFDSFSRVVCGYPYVESLSIRVQNGNNDSIESTFGPPVNWDAVIVPEPMRDRPFLVLSGSDTFVVIPLCLGGDLGRLMVKMASSANQDAEKMVSVLKELSRLVSRRVKIQELLREMREERVLTDVLSTLSHDLRTPLACIKGYATLLMSQEHELDVKQRQEFFRIILEECDHIERLIASLLDCTTEDEAFKVHKEPVLIPALLKKVLRDRSFLAREHRFLLDFPPNAREVWADPVRLEQVFRNLIDNAVKYSPEGSLVVIRARPSRGDILISVADQGYGIAPEHLNRLFDRFYRIRNEESKHVSGTGLGLPIARRIIEAHGGNIWAESTVGKGTTFYFRLPPPDCDLADTEADNNAS
ncbi:MAG: ATP-binding protein [Bacillota bacterium]